MTGDGRLSAQIAVVRAGFTLDVRVDAVPGRTLALVGPNGAGKSTTIGCIAGYVAPDAGHVQVGGAVWEDTSQGAVVPVEKRRVGVVFQDYLLFPHLSVVDNVAFGLRAAGTGKRDAHRQAREWLDRFDIGALAARRPADVSGGQAQRVALARALATSPDVLLLDEPLAALDVEVRAQTRLELARHLGAYRGVTIVVTHSIEDVVAFAADVVVIEQGAVTQRASVEDFLRAPATDYARRLVDGR